MKKQLPFRPNLEQLKKQAKAILRGQRAGDAQTLREIEEHHPRGKKAEPFALSAAQHVLAREYGFETWVKLKAHVAALESSPPSESLVNALRDAAGRGDLETVNRMLDGNPGIINEPGGPGVRTALHQAVFGKQEAAVRVLLERGADPNIRCEGDFATPLHFAAEKQLFPIIQLLVEHGADTVGEGDYHELGVLGWATAWDYVQADREIVEYLLVHGARHNIFSVVAVGDVEAIRELVAESRENLERRMDLANKRRRPLHLAVIKKQPAALAALLEKGANTESLDEAGFTALDEAAFRDERAMAQTLTDHGAKVRLPAAVALERTRDVERLLRRDPECLKLGGRWGNLIVRASEIADGRVIEALIGAGAAVDVRDDPKTAVDSTWGYTPLHAAAFRGNRSAVEVLLRHGARVDVREEKYRGTPAGWANYAGQTEVRNLILKEPVDIMEAAEYGLTGRVLAIIEEDAGALDREFGAYPLYPLYAEEWYTPLAMAAVCGRTETVRALLGRGAKAAVRVPDGRTAAGMARERGHEEIAKMLERGGNER